MLITFWALGNSNTCKLERFKENGSITDTEKYPREQEENGESNKSSRRFFFLKKDSVISCLQCRWAQWPLNLVMGSRSAILIGGRSVITMGAWLKGFKMEQLTRDKAGSVDSQHRKCLKASEWSEWLLMRRWARKLMAWEIEWITAFHLGTPSVSVLNFYLWTAQKYFFFNHEYNR